MSELSRRQVVIMLGLAILAAACGVKPKSIEATPSQISKEAQLVAQAKAQLEDALLKEYGIKKVSAFELGKTGININILTDNPSGIQVNSDAINALFNSIPDPNYLPSAFDSSQPNQTNYQKIITDLHAQALKGGFKGAEIDLVIPSDPGTCTVGSDILKKIPKGTNSNVICTSTGRTISAMISDQGNIKPAKFLAIILEAGVNSGNTVNFYAGKPDQPVTFDAEQSVASTLFHESIHALLRMSGFPQADQEEIYVTRAERSRMEFLQQNPSRNIYPVTFVANK